MCCFAMVASSRLHKNLFIRILQAPTCFFDTTPHGRILNRFSQDLDIIDQNVPWSIRRVLNLSMKMLGTAFVICYSTPLFCIPMVVLVVAYLTLQVENHHTLCWSGSRGLQLCFCCFTSGLEVCRTSSVENGMGGAKCKISHCLPLKLVSREKKAKAEF